MITRFGAIGDIHAEDESLALALERLSQSNVDAILAVGDIVDGHGDVDRCCQLLRDHRALVVRGNHDRWFARGSFAGLPNATKAESVRDENRLFLDALPATRRHETIAGPLLLCHAVGEDDMVTLREDTYGYALETNDALQELLRSDYRLMVAGHTHTRMVRRIERLTIINAGTLHREYAAGFVLVDLHEKVAQYFDVREGAVSEAERHAL